LNIEKGIQKREKIINREEKDPNCPKLANKE
jgi:hypothetical protein